MTATDELRKLLDERGVEYVENDEYAKKYPPEQSITWSCDIAGEDMTVTARDYFIGDGEYCLDLEFHEVFTPAQAIAATLGPREQPPYGELIEALRRDWDIEASWDGLRRFWYVGLTDEGVRKRDEREATLGRGECHEVIVDEYWRGCGNCGYVWEYMYGIGKCTRPNFCPRCGAKVVGE